MRYVLMAAALSMLATQSRAASPAVTENLTGTISGSQTVDTEGYFGKAGANLSGAAVKIYLQYVPALLGSSQTCRNQSCTYNEAYQTADTQGSLLVTITVNGHRVVYTPTDEGVVFFSTQSPYQLTVDSDAFSGFGIGLPGIQLAARFTSAPVFGQSLSPGNGPVLRASGSDYIDFYDAANQTPVEELSYAVTGGSS